MKLFRVLAIIMIAVLAGFVSKAQINALNYFGTEVQSVQDTFEVAFTFTGANPIWVRFFSAKSDYIIIQDNVMFLTNDRASCRLFMPGETIVFKIPRSSPIGQDEALMLYQECSDSPFTRLVALNLVE